MHRWERKGTHQNCGRGGTTVYLRIMCTDTSNGLRIVCPKFSPFWSTYWPTPWRPRITHSMQAALCSQQASRGRGWAFLFLHLGTLRTLRVGTWPTGRWAAVRVSGPHRSTAHLTAGSARWPAVKVSQLLGTLRTREQACGACQTTSPTKCSLFPVPI